MKRNLTDLRPNDLVKHVGVSPSYASELLARKKSPSLGVALKIETAFGIPANAWRQSA